MIGLPCCFQSVFTACIHDILRDMCYPDSFHSYLLTFPPGIFHAFSGVALSSATPVSHDHQDSRNLLLVHRSISPIQVFHSLSYLNSIADDTSSLPSYLRLASCSPAVPSTLSVIPSFPMEQCRHSLWLSWRSTGHL